MKKIISNILFAGLVSCGIAAATSCSKDEYGPDPERNWAASDTLFTSADERGFQTYYNPAIGRCGDPMPFFDQKAGEFKVLYLQ